MWSPLMNWTKICAPPPKELEKKYVLPPPIGVWKFNAPPPRHDMAKKSGPPKNIP